MATSHASKDVIDLANDKKTFLYVFVSVCSDRIPALVLVIDN